jgi:hypothetical protein
MPKRPVIAESASMNPMIAGAKSIQNLCQMNCVISSTRRVNERSSCRVTQRLNSINMILSNKNIPTIIIVAIMRAVRTRIDLSQLLPRVCHKLNSGLKRNVRNPIYHSHSESVIRIYLLRRHKHIQRLRPSHQSRQPLCSAPTSD